MGSTNQTNLGLIQAWAARITPGQAYTRTFENPLRVILAVLEASNTPQVAKLRVQINDETKLILCTLRADSKRTSHFELALVFEPGTQISFESEGSPIALAGHFMLDTESDDEDDEFGDEDMDVSDEDIDDDNDAPAKSKTTILGKKNEKNTPDKQPLSLVPTNAKETPKKKPVETPKKAESTKETPKKSESTKETPKKATLTKETPKKAESTKETPKQKKETPKKKAETPKDSESETTNETPKKVEDSPQTKRFDLVTTSTGLKYQDGIIGKGKQVQTGKPVTIKYKGMLQNGKQFDSSNNFIFRLGIGEVVRGFDEGVSGMKVGGRRRLTIPPKLGYGAKGAPPDIPGNSTLIFDIEVVKA